MCIRDSSCIIATHTQFHIFPAPVVPTFIQNDPAGKVTVSCHNYRTKNKKQMSYKHGS